VHVPTPRKVRVAPLRAHPVDEPRLNVTMPLVADALSVYEVPTYAFANGGDVKLIDCILSALTVIA
jgi:hypothetical protein